MRRNDGELRPNRFFKIRFITLPRLHRTCTENSGLLEGPMVTEVTSAIKNFVVVQYTTLVDLV